MSTVVMCMAETAARAAGILIALRAAGVPDQDISVVCADRSSDNASGPDLGGTLRAALAGLGSLELAAFPGIGRFAVFGPLARAVREQREAGGTLNRMFRAMGTSPADAARFEVGLASGGTVLAALARDGDRMKKLVEVLHSQRARHIMGAVPDGSLPA